MTKGPDGITMVEDDAKKTLEGSMAQEKNDETGIPSQDSYAETSHAGNEPGWGGSQLPARDKGEDDLLEALYDPSFMLEYNSAITGLSQQATHQSQVAAASNEASIGRRLERLVRQPKRFSPIQDEPHPKRKQKGANSDRENHLLRAEISRLRDANLGGQQIVASL